MSASPPRAFWCTGPLDLSCCPIVSRAPGIRLTYLWRSFMNLCTGLYSSLCCQGGGQHTHVHFSSLRGVWAWFEQRSALGEPFCCGKGPVLSPSVHPEESRLSIDLSPQPLVLIYSLSASSQAHLYSNCRALKWHATFVQGRFLSMPRRYTCYAVIS